jgi:hypothetical protein
MNVPVGTLQLLAPNYQNAYYGLGSVDYNISDRDQVRGRFFYNRLDTIETGAVLPAFFNLQPSRVYLGTLSEFHNFTPNVLNELRLGYLRSISSFPSRILNFRGSISFLTSHSVT